MRLRKLVSGLALGLCASLAFAQSQASAPAAGDRLDHSAPVQDGQRDFDWDFGTWKTHSSRLLHPLSGSTTWVELDGITEVKKIWGGKANIALYKASGTSGSIELLSLRWYNAKARQWNLDFATPAGGTLGVPAVGEFRNARGVFYDQETFDGRTILLRFSIWGITADTGQSEQAFSIDGGKTWETNWVNKYTRAAP
jgi:hypothetical protein